MCGICMFFYNEADGNHELLKRRGPDVCGSLEIQLTEGVTAHCIGTTLHFQGEITKQPLIDSDKNVLLWNGEVFNGFDISNEINDGVFLLNQLQACNGDKDVLNTFIKLQGPWAFIYWQNSLKKLWFGRDVFGRRSLLIQTLSSGLLKGLSSVHFENKLKWKELPANGIYCLSCYDDNTDTDKDIEVNNITLFPWLDNCNRPGIFDINCECSLPIRKYYCSDEDLIMCTAGQYGMVAQVGMFNKEMPSDALDEQLKLLGKSTDPLAVDNIACCSLHEEANKGTPRISTYKLLTLASQEQLDLANSFINHLSLAVKCRVTAQASICGQCIKGQVDKGILTGINDTKGCHHARVAVLFSGGIDSLLIAALSDRHIPIKEPIDLLNVAFEQKQKLQQGKHNKPLENQQYLGYNVPDRITGIMGHNILKQLNPNRIWNFVEINVTAEELQTERIPHIATLLKPLSTVLDDSIGCAIWFAARGMGLLRDPDNSVSGNSAHDQSNNSMYHSPARVVLVGMGADEQLAGYSRHRSKFSAGGWSGLVEEMKMDIDRNQVFHRVI